MEHCIVDNSYERILGQCRTLGSRVGLPSSRQFAVSWMRVESALQTTLPQSYKSFIEYFGPGRFADELQYCVPGIENEAYELEAQLALYQELARRPGPYELRKNIFSGSGGLIPFGQIGDDTIYWDTTDCLPDWWPIVLIEGGDYLLRYEDGLVSLIADMLDEAPSVDRLAYDPTLLSHFEPDEGRW